MQIWIWAFRLLCAALCILAAITLYRALLHDRSRGRRRCPRCWYDMTSIPGLTCPECGRRFARERSLHRTRHHWRLLLAGALLIPFAYIVWSVPTAIISRNWWDAVPRPLLCVVVNIYDDDEDALLVRLAGRLHASQNRLTRVERLLVARRCAALLSRPPPATPPPPPPPPPNASLPRFAAIRNGRSASSRPLATDPVSRAFDILSDLRADGWPATSALLKLARDPSSSSRRDAIRSLVYLKSPSTRALAVLADLLNDASVCGVAMDALLDLGPAAAPIIPQLKSYLLSNPDTANGAKGLRLIRKIRGDDAALAVCREMLASSSRLARLSAAQVASEIPGGTDLIPVIAGVVTDPRAPTGIQGVKSLRAFGPPARLALVALASSDDLDISRAAKDALTAMAESE